MKVYDCFCFFNELELLDIRLHILKDVVDYFVLVEIPRTHSGKKKELIFKKNKDKYSEFLDRIYISPDKVPDVKTEHGDWTIENYQRNCIFYGLNGRCDSEDIVMISDLDEIPDPEIISKVKSADFKMTQRKTGWSMGRQLCHLYSLMGWKRFLSTSLHISHRNINDLLDFTPVTLQQRMFQYYMNLEERKLWSGTVMYKWKKMYLPQQLRNMRSYFPICQNGGWHFTYLGGRERVMYKLNSIVEGQECNDQAFIEEAIENSVLTGGDRLGQGKSFRLIEKENTGLSEKILNYIGEKYPGYIFR